MLDSNEFTFWNRFKTCRFKESTLGTRTSPSILLHLLVFGSKTGFSQIVLLLGGSLTQDELYTGQQLWDLKPKKKDIIMNLEWMINETFLLFNRERLYGKLFYLFITVHLLNPDGTPGYRNGNESFFGLKGRPSVVRDVKIHNQPVLRMRRK